MVGSQVRVRGQFSFTDKWAWIVLAAGLVGCTPSRSQPKPPVQPIRVLFIGNSHVYFNNLPHLLAKIATDRDPQRPIVTDRVVEGGATLEKHWQQRVALDRIRQGKWQYVILQEQSQQPLLNPSLTTQSIRQFHQEIQTAGAKTVLFLTWTPRFAADQQATVNQFYEKTARQFRVKLAPIGSAWQFALAQNPGLPLYDADERHAAPAGSYLAACVLYAAMFQRSPVGDQTPVADLASDSRALMQQVAWKTVKSEPDPL